jgi:hypothetical protein
VVLEEIHVLGHLVDLPLDLLELGLETLEVGLEVQHLLRTLVLLRLATAALAFLEHHLYSINARGGDLMEYREMNENDSRVMMDGMVLVAVMDEWWDG